MEQLRKVSYKTVLPALESEQGIKSIKRINYAYNTLAIVSVAKWRVVLIVCNGTKVQAEILRDEIHGFLKEDLKLDLSLEKTKVTHLNDGFKYLGFWIQRKMGHKGMTTKVLIPPESINKVIDKITEVTDPGTH